MIGRRRRLGPGLNLRLIVPVASGSVLAVGLGMVVCMLVALAGDGRAVAAFGIPAAALIPLSIGGLLSGGLFRSVPLRARDGFLAVTLAWVAAAGAGCAPFMIEGTLPDFLDAFFESMSGFTTTGATLIDDVEGQPDAILLWRSLSQWMGGAGIVVLVVAIAPAVGLATHRVFFAETSKVTAERLTPRIADTAKIIWGLYLGFTAAGFVAYLLAGMGAFDAINHILTTISSGGFSTRQDSLAAFDSVAIELVAIVFMILSGVNFAFYWRAMRGRDLWPQAAEVRAYLLIIAASTAAITVALLLSDVPGSGWEHLRHAAFAATSFVSSTALITETFGDWPDFATTLLVMLMFVGGCAGSTAGGMKVIRVMLLFKTAGQEVQRQLRPKAVMVLRTRGRVFNDEVRRGVLGFCVVYFGVAIAGALALLASGLDSGDAIGGTIASLNIVGTSIGDGGATDNFTDVSDFGRAVILVLMLAGRLEVFTVLVLFTPVFWKPNVA